MEKDKKLRQIREVDDLTMKQFRRVQEAVLAVPMAAHDKDMVLANLMELLNPQARAKIS